MWIYSSRKERNRGRKRTEQERTSKETERARERTNPKIILLIVAIPMRVLSILKNVYPYAYNLLETLAKSLLFINKLFLKEIQS